MRFYDLYFDESGTFQEPVLLEEGSVKRFGSCERGASQIVGILAPSGTITVSKMDSILKVAHNKARRQLGREFHAKELLESHLFREYSKILSEVCHQLEDSLIQPVRICNTGRMGFGDKIATYTCMVAEMVIHVLEELTRIHGGGKIGLNIIAASVLTNWHDKSSRPEFIEKAEYKKRLNEQLAFTAVRRGVAHNRVNWEIATFRFGSGIKDRPLQICDLLSNASFRKFNNCSADQKERLKKLFGKFDVAMNKTNILEEIERHRREGSIAHALQTTAENWNRTELDTEVRKTINEQCRSIVDDLAQMSSTARNLHLRQIADWGGQFVELRDLKISEMILLWLNKHIAEPLANRINDQISADVDWFQFKLRLMQLAGYNHQGRLTAARTVTDLISQKIPDLLGRWEHVSLVMEALTLQAVHLIDSVEYDEASNKMQAVAGCFDNMSTLMLNSMTGLSPERIRSRHLGMALGTWLQSEMFAGIENPERLNKARRLNERAIEEFTAKDDKDRQYQYRSQIETYAGNFAEARNWLARSLNIADSSHESLANTIKDLDGFAQGFALLHWSRIGMEAARRQDDSELNEFVRVFTSKEFVKSSWIMSPVTYYPAHGIHRHIAIALAAKRDLYLSKSVLNRLLKFETNGNEALVLIKLAGITEALTYLPHSVFRDTSTVLNGASDWYKPISNALHEYACNVEKFSRLHKLVVNIFNNYIIFEESMGNSVAGLRNVCRCIA